MRPGRAKARPQPAAAAGAGVRSEEATMRGCDGARSCDGIKCTTTLLSAVQGQGNLDVVKYLIDKNVDPNRANNHGITPLHAAAGQGYYEIAEYLLTKGANVDPISQDGETPLHNAAHNGHARMVKLLLEHNADLNRLSHKHRTPLVESLIGSSLDCLDILIKAGADVNPAGSPVAPVTFAAVKGLDQCIELLLKNGANPDMPDEDGNMPIEIAASKGYEKCVRNLVPYAAPLDKYDGLSSADIVLREKLFRHLGAIMATAEGDSAYWAKNYGTAVSSYTKALKLDKDPDLYAKRSLSHLYMRDQGNFMDDALAYSKALARQRPDAHARNPSENDARRLVLKYAKEWKERAKK